MASIVVCGAGPVGLAAAMMLARDGHDVTVLEGDPQDAPAEAVRAWDGWSRRGVAQFHQPHSLFSRFRVVCEEELPGLVDRMIAAGCVSLDPIENLPPTLTDRARRPDDDRFTRVTGRRPVVEAVLAAAAQEEDGVEVRRGVRVAGLLAGSSPLSGVPHVVGVVSDEGEAFPADLVVEATGRRTRSAAWLQALGARPPIVESLDSGFVYFTRYFTGSAKPVPRAAPLVPLGSISLLTLDSDNDTWSVSLFGRSTDGPLKAARDVEAFNRVLKACPLHAQWLDGTAMGGVMAIAGIADRYRRFVVEGRPVATGFAAVGDAWACTNPSAGRGITVGLVHAQLLRRTVAEHGADPAAFAAAWDAVTEEVAAPFFRNQVAADRTRFAEMAALSRGEPPPPPSPAVAALQAAAATDADAFRALLEIAFCLAQPQEVFARPEIRRLVADAAGQGPRPTPGPDRAQLLGLLGG
jgi:2-polyprenyl-6-methoxyphenol hydroxylase-like FAD-dependent oxidoreductase